MDKIINNNWTVIRYFDDVPEGFACPKYLSKEDAELHLPKNGHLTSYAVFEHVSILGIIPFNEHKAYIFNKLPTEKCNDAITITAGTYENLMNCYVFQSYEISKKQGDELEIEYYKRGGKLYSDYHDFKNEVLRPEQKRRQKEFRNELIESFFKHNFREIGKKKWANNDGVIIKEINVQHSSSRYSYIKNYLDIDYKYKLYISALFSKYLKDVRQFEENKFCVPCLKNSTQTYKFVCFDVEFNKK